MSTKLDLPRVSSDVRNRVSASLFYPDSPLRWRGKVDVLSIEDGIEGWVLDLDAPKSPLRLQLLIGDEIVAETSTGLKRPDVVALLGSEATPGFQFSSDCFAHVAGEQARFPLRIGLVDEKVEILSDTALPTLAELRDADATPLVGFDLMERLGSLRSSAAFLTALPLRPSTSKEVGYIELFSIEPSGLVWLQGWMNRGAAIDAPIAIVDGRKEPGGFTYTYFERDDLPSDKCGFVGVLHSSWTPSATTAPLIFLKGDELAHLNCVKPPRIIKHSEFAPAFKKLAGRCHTGATAALLRLLESPESWVPSDLQHVAAIDSALVVPGFGCVISGWVVNTLSFAKRFSLRVGATILSSDESSLYYRARPDLITVAPGCEILLKRAGFVVAFRGSIAAEDFGQAVLKVIYDDGIATCHAIEAKIFRTIGAAVEPEALLELYPTLQSEPFFAELSEALRKYDRRQASSWNLLRPAIMRQAVICVLGETRSSVYLQVEQIRANVRADSGVGVILVADEASSRSDALLLRESLVNTTGIVCGVVLARCPKQALYALDTVLSTISCERFVFLGPGIVLTPSGWHSAFHHLNSTDDIGCFFALNDPCSTGDDNFRSAAAFGWSREGISSWLEQAPALLGGYAGDNGLGGHLAITHLGAAWFTRMLDGSPFVMAVNQHVNA